jgi:CheY-like chemotaxis protein
MEPAARPTILLVDDDVANLRVFERSFRTKWAVITASSTKAALLLVRQHPTIDVAFVDFLMPDATGDVVLAELRRTLPRVACYLLTGYGELDDMKKLKRDGLCRGVLAKPWDRATIEAAVAEAQAPADGTGARG